MGKRIQDLDNYADVDVSKATQDLYEVSKNTGTAGSPIYATDGSRKITAEKLKESLNIKDYVVRDFIVKNSGDTLEEDKVNAIIVSTDTSFTLPTASISNYGKSLVVANRSTYTVTLNSIVTGSIKLTNYNEVAQFVCLFDGVSTYGWWILSDATTDKICSKLVEVVANTYNAIHNDNIEANAQNVGSDINITIPTAGIEGRLIYVFYPSGSPSSYVVNLIGGFTATLNQLDYFLLRDNGSYWDAISTSQNVATTPNLDAVTTAGNTTTNGITVGSAILSNVTVNTLAFLNSSKQVVTALGTTFGTWLQTLTADTTPVDADTVTISDSTASFEAKKTTLLQLWTNYLLAKVQSLGYLSGSLTNNFIPKSNGAGGLVDSFSYEDTNYFYNTKNGFRTNSTLSVSLQLDTTGASATSTIFLKSAGAKSIQALNLASAIQWQIYDLSGQMYIESNQSTGLTLSSVGGTGSHYISIRNAGNTYYNNATHTFLNASGTKIGELSVTGLSLGSSSINSATQLDLQATNKGLGLNIITTRPTGRKANTFYNNTNSVIEYSDTTGASYKELAVYKFDELLQISDCLTTFTTANTGIYFPFVPKSDINVTKIFYNLQSAGTDTVRVAIYSDVSNMPTTLLIQGNEATTGATTTGQRSITISLTRLIGGTRYWIAIKNDNGATGFLNKNNVYSNSITRESFTSGAFVTTPAPSSSVNAVWLGIGI